MTRTQAKGNLVSLGIEEPTEEQITAYLNAVNGESQKYKDKATKADELQKQLEDLEKQNMSESDQVKADLEKANQTISALNKQLNRSTVEGIFKGAGLVEDDYKDVIDNMLFDDPEVTKTFANNFVNVIGKQKQVATDQAKKDLLDSTPTPGNQGNQSQADTKSDSEKIAESLAKNSSESNKATESVMSQYL